jgi:hypothetical protein
VGAPQPTSDEKLPFNLRRMRSLRIPWKQAQGAIAAGGFCRLIVASPVPPMDLWIIQHWRRRDFSRGQSLQYRAIVAVSLHQFSTRQTSSRSFDQRCGP